MCGRVFVDYEEIMSVAGGSALASWIKSAPTGAHSSWNIAPTQQIPIAATDPLTGDKHFQTAYWSLLPPWAKELKPKFPTFNARAETAATKPSFKAAVQHGRCAIPVTGFYEWSGPQGARVPHAIHGPDPVLTLAGLYSWWRAPESGPNGEWHLTATILTSPSTGKMAEIHDRMPVFLAPELTAEWLDPLPNGDQRLINAAVERATTIAEGLRIHAVRPLRGDGPELLAPA
ncbi:SOS response-associated peptidase [Leucobacter salsicius]|uniref:SOS response-associated peptidase n=1 Tax=Leucobacter salsicius TaxID=664638 RepID=UPI0009FD9EFB|nr:SOS response-associated peptidase [Leucobacter salsicius]